VVVRCRHCADYYWLADAEKVGTVERWRGEGQQRNPAWSAAQEAEEPTEEEYYQALEGNCAKDHEQERTLRMLAWWRRNDALRFHAAGSATASGACRRNLEALARLLDENGDNDRLLKAEVFRELGEFELAKEVLGRVGSPTYRGAVRQLRDLCARGDRCVRQLSFEESQDVGALIEMAKTTGGRARLAAIRALAAIGPDAQEAVPLLVRLLRDSDAEVAFAVGHTLCEIGNWADQAAPVLMEPLSDERHLVRGLAAKLLGESGPYAKAAAPALRVALGDESCYVRMYAERALRAVQEQLLGTGFGELRTTGAVLRQAGTSRLHHLAGVDAGVVQHHHPRHVRRRQPLPQVRQQVVAGERPLERHGI
jgi:hypothetical protein